MIVRPSVKSEPEFWAWVDTWPVGKSFTLMAIEAEYRPDDYAETAAWDVDPAALHLLFGYRHYKESEWPHNAWSDLADSIYFAIKRLDYFDVHWRVKPEIDATMVRDHRMVRQSYVRLTVVPRERINLLMPLPYKEMDPGFTEFIDAVKASNRKILEMVGIADVDHLFSPKKPDA